MIELLSLPLQILRLCGVNFRARSPGITRKQKLLHNLRLFYFWFTFFNFAIGQIFQFINLTKTSQDVKVFVAVLAGAVNMMGVEISILTILRHKDEINKIFDQWVCIDISRLDLKDDYKRRIVKLLKEFKHFEAVKVIASIVTRIMFCIGPIAKYFKTGFWYQDLPWKIWFPIDLTEKVSFNVAYVWSCWMVTASGFFMFVADLMTYAVIMVLAFQLIILSHDITKAIEERKNLKTLVTRHCELIEAVAKVKEIFSEIFLIQVVGSSILISIGAYYAVFSNEPTILIKFGFLFFMVLFKVSFLCHLGNFLTESSQLVVESIVLSDWHEQSTNTKLCVKMMQTQALRGCDLTAGKFFKLDFITLQIILKAGYSYFTFLEVIN